MQLRTNELQITRNLQTNMDSLISELTEYIQSLCEEPNLPRNEQWHNNLKTKVQCLVGKYLSKNHFIGDGQDGKYFISCQVKSEHAKLDIH